LGKRFRPGDDAYPIELGGGWWAALEMDTEHEGWVFLKQGDTTWGGIPVDARGDREDERLGPVWHLTARDPVTVRPSVHLVGVVHDWIDAGKWRNGGAPG
jgi:hypothetical protein